MIKSGIKKELMLFTRGFKLLGVIITIFSNITSVSVYL